VEWQLFRQLPVPIILELPIAPILRTLHNSVTTAKKRSRNLAPEVQNACMFLQEATAGVHSA